MKSSYLNRHVNVHVDLGPLDDHVVDFNIDDFKSSYTSNKITDARARAHYFNNMGVESMQAGDTASALAYFRRGIAENDRNFSPIWTNLGTLYLRNGKPDLCRGRLPDGFECGLRRSGGNE